jgi:parallel beta-helix repeat protein
VGQLLGILEEAKMMSAMRVATAAATAFVCGSSLSAPASQSQTFTVDCAKGQTVSSALERGDERKPLVLIIKGTCNENVAINRDDVVLRGDPKQGATIDGASAANTITVRASRIHVDRLNVRGGNPNGIALLGGSNVEISNSDIQYAAGQGINVTGTSAVTIANCSVQHNTRAGIGVAQASVEIANSRISFNSGAGVIGVWDASMAISNSEIASNATSGVRAIRHSSVTV